MDQWRSVLLEARQRAGVGRKKLAELSGVSVETIRGYEIGRRHPRHESLEAILTALGVARGEANTIRERAGFAPVRTEYGGSPTYYYSPDELNETVERAPWPQFVVDDGFEVVAANRRICALWAIRSFAEEQARRGGRGQMNVFALLNAHELPRYIGNWDELVEMIAGFIKGRPALPPGEATDELFRETVFDPFRGRDRRFLERLQASWGRAKPVSPRIRWDYPVVWDHPRVGTMRFHGFVSPANEREGLVFNDWIPADGDSWTRLHELTST